MKKDLHIAFQQNTYGRIQSCDQGYLHAEVVALSLCEASNAMFQFWSNVDQYLHNPLSISDAQILEVFFWKI